MSPKMQYIIQNRIMTMYAVDKFYSQNTYFAMLKVKKYGLHGGTGGQSSQISVSLPHIMTIN